MQEKFLETYREKYPPLKANADSMRANTIERYVAPQGYNDLRDHHRVFLEAVKSRKPVTENSTFGFRAAGPALASNVSYFEQRVCGWNADTMTLKG